MITTANAILLIGVLGLIYLAIVPKIKYLGGLLYLMIGIYSYMLTSIDNYIGIIIVLIGLILMIIDMFYN